MSPSWSWTNKSFTVSKSGHTYAYIHHSPSTTNKPTLLLLHGFPSTSYDWRHQIPYLKNLGYGVLVPDLLGYGSSSKPLAVEPYIGLSMASDIISILDHESIQTVVGVGHDWGTYLLSQLIIWFPERISRCVFVSVPFHIPGRKTDVEAVNQKSRRALGFEILGYWMFLTAPDAGKIIEDNWKTFYNIIYCTDASLWKTHFAPLGAMRKTLETMTPESSSQYLAPHSSSPTSKSHHHTSFKNTYTQPTNWYHRALSSLGTDTEISALKKGVITSSIHIPALMITGTEDVICDSGHARRVMERVVEGGKEKLRVVDFRAGHWVMLERRGEFNCVLGEWLMDTDGGGGGGERAKL